MSLEQELIDFWNAELMPRFREQALNAQVSLLDGTRARYVNLDNAATTKPFKSIVEKLVDDLDEYGSVHRGAGQHSEITTDKYESARETIARFVGATSEHYVLFTKNTTESINHAAALFAEIPGKVLVSDIEHSSNLLPWIKNGQVVQYKTLDDCTIDKDDIVKILKEHAKKTESERIKLLAITGSSNVTGYKPNIHYLAMLAHQYEARILIDVCQLVPHEKINMLHQVYPEHLDFIAFSGHKMYAPFGAGVLIGPKSFFDKVRPYQIGGGNLPYITSDLEIKRFNTVRTHDPGTPNAIGVLAIEEAIKQLEEIGFERIKDYEHKIVGLTLKKLKKITNVTIYLHNECSSVIPFDIENIPAKLVAQILAKEYGVGTRAGNFCVYELLRKIKGVIKEEDEIISAEVDNGITANIPAVVRASFSIFNNIEDSSRLVSAVREISNNGFNYYKSKYNMDKKTGDWKHITI